MRRLYQLNNITINEENLLLQETIFHNANGYIGVRGTLEEGVSSKWDTMRGMYLNGFYDVAPMKQAEKLCNLIEDKDCMVNVADTQTIQVMFGGERFFMTEHNTRDCSRTLDMDNGITSRSLVWNTQDGKEICFDIVRMASFSERSLFVIDYQFTSEDFEGDIVIESGQNGLVKNYCNVNDPRMADEGAVHLQKENHCIEDNAGYLVSSTIKSGLKVTSGVKHELYLNDSPCPLSDITYEEKDHRINYVFKFHIKPGDRVRLIKYTIFTDSVRWDDCLEKAMEKLDYVTSVGVDEFYNRQKAFLTHFWNNSAMEISGDDDLNASVEFNMYQLLQSAGIDGHSSIAAKGLSGEGYEGHYFWDTEMFMLPYFALTNPEIARKLLDFRYTTLASAKENAGLLGHKKGALYPWRTITGTECSGYFPSGTAQYHINGDIAYAIILYYKATGDWDFMREKGMKILLETSRLWMDVGNFCDDKFVINCVTGPDEYTCMVNNNYYTNACAKYNLEWFVKLSEQFSREESAWKAFVRENNLSTDEICEMNRAQENMYLPYDEKLGINPQDDSFLQKPVWDLKNTDQNQYPLLMNYHPLYLYRYQVCKQADTILAHYLFPEYQDLQTEINSFLYYEKVTTHDSSLSTCVFSIMASKLGMKDKAYQYFGDSAKLDLMNTHKNTKDGIHAANMGGCYMAIVNGFAGVRIETDGIYLAPQLPEQWTGYSFRIQYHGSLLEIQVTEDECKIQNLEGSPVRTVLYGTSLILDKGKSISVRINSKTA